MVEGTLNLIAHSRKVIRFCIFFILYTFLIWLTVYEIVRGKKKTSLSRKRQPKMKILISSIFHVHYHVMHCVIHNMPSRSLFYCILWIWVLIDDFWKNFLWQISSFFQISRLGLNLEQNMWISEITFIKFSTRTNLYRFLIHCGV